MNTKIQIRLAMLAIALGIDPARCLEMPAQTFIGLRMLADRRARS